jgi:phage terminase large subunit-like protein
MHPMKDKRARLYLAVRYIEVGAVKFPGHGCEQFLTQLLGFGGEKHYDAVDALVYSIVELVGEGIAQQEMRYV